ncbi:hypothetical protein AB6735_23060 [Mucilaginibacter sp. RCC_168]|uniref:hypothetical protein n=1 Tax=Mucilaginibacter sp. RCC_168 TaxID=3239221 RepID=UPI0035236E03
MIRNVVLLFLGYFVIQGANAQNSSTNAASTGTELTTPPNAAAFTTYGKVPVSQFTGVADIKVPLYNIKVDNLNLPIYLSYYSKGIQPNSHAGWVGTGWSLFAESAITRKINGMTDEYVNPDIGITTVNGRREIGWYYADVHNRLNNGTWSSQSQIVKYTGDNIVDGAFADAAADEFDFNINGISGAFFMGEDGKWKVRAAGGENITIEETLGQCTFNTYPLNTLHPFSNTIYNTFTKFVLTTGDGTKYVFGGGNPANNTSIDFNRAGPHVNYNYYIIPMAWHITQIILPSGKTINYNYFRDGVQLTYSPFANGAYYNYQDGVKPAWYQIFDGYGISSSTTNNDFLDASMNFMDPVHLQSITFPEGKLIFNSTVSPETNQLDYPYTGLNFMANTSVYSGAQTAYSIFNSFFDLTYNIDPNLHDTPSCRWRQLNDIELDDYNGNKLKNEHFSYGTQGNYTNQNGISIATTRMFLNSVQETGYYNSTTGTSLPPYTFQYNTTPLPAYATLQTDHWGFYIGPSTNRLYKLPTTFDSHNFPDATWQAYYTNFREPDATYVTAGILTQINYPSGGYSQFTYEANRYRKWVADLPITVNMLSADAIGGGVRVKNIVTTDAANAAPITYEYSYVNDLASNVSSGVLGMSKPVYFNVTSQFRYGNGTSFSYLTADYAFYSSNPIFPSQNDDGNIVTYGNVIERQKSNGTYNGMTVNTYSNHDNGYGNNGPDAAFWILSSETSIYHYNDRAFERGMLLTQLTTDNNNKPIKLIQNTYNNDSNRFNSFVKSVFSTSRVQQVNAGGATRILNFWKSSAIRNYTFYPYLQQSVETDYPSDQTAPTTVTTTNYVYDAVNGTKNMVQKTLLNSNGEKLINNYTYPLDFSQGAGDSFTLGIINLRALKAVSLPVEQYTQRSNGDGTNLRTVAGSLNSYNTDFPIPDLVYKTDLVSAKSNFLKATNATGLTKDASYQPRTYIDRLDPSGNPLQQHTAYGRNQSYQWGYNSNYPTVFIDNASNTYKVTTTQTTSGNGFTIQFPYTDRNTYTQQFTVGADGATVLSIDYGGDEGSGTVRAEISIDITGPNNYDTGFFSLCLAGGTATCGNYSSSRVINGLAPGTYTLQGSIYDLQNLSLPINLSVSYPTLLTTTTTSGVKDFYFDGFEEGGGNSSVNDSKTGHLSFIGAYTKPLTNLSSKNYVLSYWLKSGGIWTLQTLPPVSVTGGTYTISIPNGQIDDVRFYPVDAKMTTYTFDPMVGITSSTDAKNETTYYEYDSFLRLMNIKDKDRNITKHNEYHYPGQ